MHNPFDSFLKVKNEFKLGSLTTESFHPLSANLSALANSDLEKAFEVLKEIDHLALDKISHKGSEVYKLSQKIKKTFENKGKVFLVGCGATGRLSLALETLTRLHLKRDDVISFMAGGDYALIKSVERFEDSQEFGKRQSNDLNFTENDFLIAITEGGETNFVIGAAQAASQISLIHPHFLYCNPQSELMGLTRCRELFENSKIDTLELVVGPMALSGSTRMQATTVQMFCVAAALNFFELDEKAFINSFEDELKSLKNLNYTLLSSLTEKEASLYQNGEILTYLAQKLSGLTILTDTTERSPTFSLPSFEKDYETFFGPAFLVIKDAKNSKEAWGELLSRTPRGLDWEDIDADLSLSEIYKFDISEKQMQKRQATGKNHLFEINTTSEGFSFKLDDASIFIPFKSENAFTRQIALKMLLNAHSTLLMGRLNRYVSNVMTWVKPSNLKLIDRATRYVIYLASLENMNLDYDEVASKVVELARNLDEKSGPIVELALRHFKNS